MALTFPSNPTTGEEFTGTFGEIYTWDGQKWTLTAGTGGSAGVAIGDTPPANPSAGNLWWDSVHGNLFIWYVDANSSQWVIANAASPIIPEAPTDGQSYLRDGATQSWVPGLPLTAGSSNTLTGSLYVAGPTNGIDCYYLDVHTSANITSISIGATLNMQISETTGAGMVRQIGWQTGYADQWQVSNGERLWIGQDSQIMALTYTGSLTIAGTLTQNSDVSKKEDINELAGGLELIKQLVPKSFRWKHVEAGDFQDDQSEHWGFIAQDVVEVIPAAVKPALEGTLGIEEMGLLAIAIQAIKELVTRVEILEGAR